MFTRGSRYLTIKDGEFVRTDGRTIRYKCIRFLPTPEGRAGYSVASGDRPDTAAWNIAQDAESYWRLCDANGTAEPADLTARPGARIVIPGPSGGGGA